MGRMKMNARVWMISLIHRALPNRDSKDIVDMPMKRPFSEVFKAFRRAVKELEMNSSSRGKNMTPPRHGMRWSKVMSDMARTSDIKASMCAKILNDTEAHIVKDFVEENFMDAGSDVVYCVPSDYDDNPKILGRVNNPMLKKMLTQLNRTWKSLSRKKAKLCDGESSTLLDLPYPFIVAGGRFRELYYWDTYWITEGLLVSGMKETLTNIVRNFNYLIASYGYIPNGTRTYYLNRSQPPYFPIILWRLYTSDSESLGNLVLNESLPMIDAEHEYFESFKGAPAFTCTREGLRELSCYRVDTNLPRLESFAEDINTLENNTGRDRRSLYSSISTAAESGWDFSTRWLQDQSRLGSIACLSQIPVDLNAVLYRDEKILEELWKIKGNVEKSEYYRERATRRASAINSVLWCDEAGVWMDFNIATGKHVNHRFYVSNISPLLYGIQPPNGVNQYSVLRKYAKEIFGYPGGVPASGEANVVSSQQWDFPNAWAPHQQMIVDYLLSINERDMAVHVAKCFFDSVYNGFLDTGRFYEKYDCRSVGDSGRGGEYVPQEGFGWTNGTIMKFIETFGDELMASRDHTDSYNHIVARLDEMVLGNAENRQHKVGGVMGAGPCPGIGGNSVDKLVTAAGF